MAKYGLFGCTADPFTLAHREIVKQVLEQKLVDYVYICPTIVDWHRKDKKPWLSDEEKLKVIEAMIDGIAFDKYEYRYKAHIYKADLKLRAACKGNRVLEDRYLDSHRFIDTLMSFKSRYQDTDEFYVIVGSDEYECFEDWFAYDSILKQSNGLIVVTDKEGNGRDGTPLKLKDNELFKNTQLLRIDDIYRDVSASKLRQTYTSSKSYLDDVYKLIVDEEKDELAYATPIFNVVKGKATETGLKPIKIDAPDWIMVIVEKDNKFLVEKQFRYGSNDDVEEFPCGMVEKGELPENAAARELAEETGIKVSPSQLLKFGSCNPNPAFMMNKIHLYYINLDKEPYHEVGQKLDANERLTYSFIDKSAFWNKIECAVKVDKLSGKVPGLLLAALELYTEYELKSHS